MDFRRRKTNKLINKQRKQVAELFLLQGKEMEELLDLTMPTSSVRVRLKDARESKTDPALMLSLKNLNGSYISHEEIRDLVQYTVIGPASCGPHKPKWCYYKPKAHLTTQCVVIRAEFPAQQFVEYPYPYMEEFFGKQFLLGDKELYDREFFWKTLLNVPISIEQQVREKMKVMENSNNAQACLRNELLLSRIEFADFGFPVPVGGIVTTKDIYAPISEKSPLFALDCEMCMTSADKHELTRISIINEEGSVIIDTLVKPPNPITDYLTRFSGMTKDLLDNVKTTLEDVQEAIRAFLPYDAILVGHSLEFDLKALAMTHPYIFDVARHLNLTGQTKSRTSLKRLAEFFLDEDIQSGVGHCSVEDSWIALRLAKLKLQKGYAFGNNSNGWNVCDYANEKAHQSSSGAPMEDEPQVKRARTESKAHFCDCGEPIGVNCILPDCLCQKSPPTKCVFCLAKNPTPEPKTATYDWGKAIKIENIAETRPLSHYLQQSKRQATIMHAVDKTEVTPETNKYLTKIEPSAFPNQQDFVDEVCMDVLSYGLCLVELRFPHTEAHEPTAGGSTSDQSEFEPINAQLEQIIRSAAKYSLIIVVLTCPSKTICCLKVKP